MSTHTTASLPFDAATVEFDPLLRRLNLASTRRHWRELLQRAETHGWSCREFLGVLVTEPEDLSGIRRALWAVDVGSDPPARPTVSLEVIIGGPRTYARCQSEARRLRAQGADAITAPSAALLRGATRGWRVDAGLRPGIARNGKVFVLYGSRPDLTGWATTVAGRPGSELLPHVRHL